MRDLKQSSEVLFWDGPQISQGQTEEVVSRRTAKNRPQCGEGTVGKVQGPEEEEAQDWGQTVNSKKRASIYRENCCGNGWEQAWHRRKGQEKNWPTCTATLRPCRTGSDAVVTVARCERPKTGDDIWRQPVDGGEDHGTDCFVALKYWW